MRTTVTLDADVAQRLQEIARQKRLSFKRVLNDAIRRGLSAPEQADAPRFVVTPHAGGFRPGVDRGKLNHLADVLEVSDFMSEARDRV
jgi:hypothetical protein